jgi:ribosomal protein S15P/S13E
MNETSGPNQLAALIEAKIGEIEAQRADASPGDERRELQRLLQQNRRLLRWCKTRAGYRAEPSNDASLTGDAA